MLQDGSPERTVEKRKEDAAVSAVCAAHMLLFKVEFQDLGTVDIAEESDPHVARKFLVLLAFVGFRL
jgi:3-hydroxy-3-methylglutaryl CoA synthase